MPPQLEPLQRVANHSPQVRQLQSYQALANRRPMPMVSQRVVQRQGEPLETIEEEIAEQEPEPAAPELLAATDASTSGASSSSAPPQDQPANNESGLDHIKLKTPYQAGTGKVKAKIEGLRTQFNTAKKAGEKVSTLAALQKLVNKNIKDKTADQGKALSEQKLLELRALEKDIREASRDLLSNEAFVAALKQDEPGVRGGYDTFLEQRYLNTKLENRRLEAHEISALSQPDGEKDAGMDQESLRYIRGDNYKDWLQIAPSKRLLISSIVTSLVEDPQKASTLKLSVEKLKKTPAYGMGLSMSGDDKTAVREHTKSMWLATINATEGSSGKRTPEEIKQNAATVGILKKVFLLLQSGLEERTKEGNYQLWTTDVSTALSHGGRVNIKIPILTAPEEGTNDPHALMKWLGITQGNKAEGNQAAGVFVRGFGSHRLDVNKKGEMKEKGGSLVGALGAVDNTKRYGLNLTVGGFDTLDFNGEYILPDGKNGHMYIGFHPPTFKAFGTLQIGIETTAPGAESNVGYKHTFKSTEATANPLSSVGGAKSDKHGVGKLGWNQIDLTTIQPHGNAPIITGIKGWLGRLHPMEAQFREGVNQGTVSNADLVAGRSGFEDKLDSIAPPKSEASSSQSDASGSGE